MQIQLEFFILCIVCELSALDGQQENRFGAIDSHIRNLGSLLGSQLTDEDPGNSSREAKVRSGAFTPTESATTASIPAPSNFQAAPRTTPSILTLGRNDSQVPKGPPAEFLRELSRCGVCPAVNLKGCCIPYVRRKLVWFLDEDISVSQSVKNAIRRGYYGQLAPTDIARVPPVVFRRLNREAIKWMTTSQARAVVLNLHSDLVTVANVLRNLETDHYNVLLTNLRLEIERGAPGVRNLTSESHALIGRTASTQWGPFQTWDGPQLSAFSFWIPYLPCHAIFWFQEEQLMSRVLPAAVVGQSRLSECSKKALFTRMYQARQLVDMSGWSADRTVTFARLLSGAPPRILRSLPQSTLQHLGVLRILTEMELTRSQVEHCLAPLAGSSLTADMIMAMQGAEKRGSLLNFMPPSLLATSIHPSVYLDTKVISALKNVYCSKDHNRSFKAGYQVYWWYRQQTPPHTWDKKDIQRLGCLVRYLSPMDMAKLNLLEMAKDIENTFTLPFRNGDYSEIQAKILFNYGTQLLHLGSGSWSRDRFIAIPPSVIPGIHIHKISEFLWEEVASKDVIDQFRKAAATPLGLNRAQIIAFLNKLATVPNGGLRTIVSHTNLAQSPEIMHYISYRNMESWRLSDFPASHPPKGLHTN